MRFSRLVLGAALAAMLGCGATDEGGDSGPSLTATTVEVLQGDGQVDTVGQQLPLAIRVKVLDSTVVEEPGGIEGSELSRTPVPIPGQLVNFVVVSGGGSVFAGSSLTDSLGNAEELWTLGPSAGEQCLEARAVEDGLPITYASVCATAVPGPLAAAGFDVDTVVVYGDSAYRIPVWAEDAFGNEVSAPEPASPDSLPIVEDSLGYRTAFNGAGWFRLVLGGDTMVVAQHLPRGRYRIAYHHNDTTWVEVGRLMSPNQGGFGDWCSAAPGGPFDGYTSSRLRTYRADSVWITRQVGAGAVDTLNQGTSNDLRACGALNYGLPPGQARFRLRVSDYLIGPAFVELNSTHRVEAFTWILPPAPGRADTLWFGLP